MNQIWNEKQVPVKVMLQQEQETESIYYRILLSTKNKLRQEQETEGIYHSPPPLCLGKGDQRAQPVDDSRLRWGKTDQETD